MSGYPGVDGNIPLQWSSSWGAADTDDEADDVSLADLSAAVSESVLITAVEAAASISWDKGISSVWLINYNNA